MKKMEELLSKETMEMQRGFAKERKKLEEQIDIDEAGRSKLLEDLKVKEESAGKQKQKQKKLLKRIQNMEEKLC